MEKRITDLLEQTADRFGDKRAVTLGKEGYTYRELRELAVRIGTFLAKRLSFGSPVPIYMDKCPDMVACLFGAAYAGDFYSPISREQPKERVCKILQTLNASAVVTDEEGADSLLQMGYEGQIFRVEEMKRCQPDENLIRSIRSNGKAGLLYVMFTSGSTGTPKGVAISQQSVLDFIGHFIDVTGITGADRIGNQAPFDFDVSVKDIYSAVSTGAELVLIPKELFCKPPRLMDYLIENEVTTLIWAVPALCILSAMKVFDYRVPSKIRKVMFSGQAMPIRQLFIWQKNLPEAQFINLYGPTEVTCNCTYYMVPEKIGEDFRLPLGNAFPGRSVFLLDENGCQVKEPGERGEICVAGESLAEGYYNNREETARRFTVWEGKRIYRTGDMAMIADDHSFYFSGRADFQVKIMGHRIELEEVEDAIRSVAGVEACCCVFNKEKGRITAFITGCIDQRYVKEKLKNKLPSYMIPAHIRNLEALPLNLNGKLDRKALTRMAV